MEQAPRPTTQNPRPIKSIQQWHAFLSGFQDGVIPNVLLNDLRQECYREIEKLRQRKLLVYFSNFNQFNSPDYSINGHDVEGFADVINVISGSGSVDILVHSPGGYADATERIVQIIRSKFDDVNFLIPHSAFSAATMMALAGNKIILHPTACLGPIDPQINGAPAKSILKGFENAREVVKSDGPEAISAYIPLLEKYSLHLLELCKDSELLSKKLVGEWLKRFMFNSDSQSDEFIDCIVTYFSDYELHLTHSRPLNFDKISHLGLKVEKADPALSDLLWESYILLTGFCTLTNFAKLYETTDPISWGRRISVISQPLPNKPQK